MYLYNKTNKVTYFMKIIFFTIQLKFLMQDTYIVINDFLNFILNIIYTHFR